MLVVELALNLKDTMNQEPIKGERNEYIKMLCEIFLLDTVQGTRCLLPKIIGGCC
jgi:hypothetical protein